MSAFPSTFQAYVYESFGDPLSEIKLREVDQPALEPGQVRIKVHAAALNPLDAMLIQLGLAVPFTKSSPTPENPFRIGFDVSGTVVEVGSDVSHLHLGDAVYGFGYFGKVGTLAEYINVDAVGVAVKPTSMSFTQAAGAPVTASLSYQGLVHNAAVKPGDRVLILGGSSASGGFGIQIAKSLGAHVIATTSARNVERVKALGADEVIDYTAQDWAQQLEPHSIDIIYCCAEPESWNDRAQRVLKKDSKGKFISVVRFDGPAIKSPIGATHHFVIVTQNTADLTAIATLADAGKLVTPIDSVHGFENALDAFKVQMSKHARGKVIVQVVSEEA